MTNTFSKVKSINVNLLDKREIKKDLEKFFHMPLLYVKGDAYSTITVMTKYGEQTGFEGDFKAYNMLTGEVYSSDAAFLPQQLTLNLLAALEKNDMVTVETTVEIIPSDKNSDGIAWVTKKPLTEEKISRATELEKEFFESIGGFKALPAPAKKSA